VTPAAGDARAEIEALLPHRPPFLFVDRILERHERGLVAEWCVPMDADWFRGHYPGEPVLPGVLLCEHAFQCAALHVAERRSGAPASGIPILTRVREARFRRIVRPGETLATRVTLEEELGPALVFGARTSVGAAVAARLSFVLVSTGDLARAFAAEGT
jgi:3-hydroxyacyl-[acyl-carrier-protein] dehydratase